MGARKAIKAEKIKAEKKQKAIAILRDCPTSPRKMRLVADIIRGVEINKALGILRFSKKEASIRQGRAHRIRKRSNHVTIVVDKMVTVENK